jgi:hypothetical protein
VRNKAVAQGSTGFNLQADFQSAFSPSQLFYKNRLNVFNHLKPKNPSSARRLA